MTDIPSLLYVGASDFDVVLKKPKSMDRDRLLGECDTANAEITINRKQAVSVMRNTVLHEALHAIFWTSGFNRELEMAKEEELVQMLAPWVLALLRDNPELVAYLTEK